MPILDSLLKLRAITRIGVTMGLADGLNVLAITQEMHIIVALPWLSIVKLSHMLVTCRRSLDPTEAPIVGARNERLRTMMRSIVISSVSFYGSVAFCLSRTNLLHIVIVIIMPHQI